MVETKSSLRELALIFLRLGFSSFGGPAVHIANMNDEFVKRRRWLTSEEFLDLLGATNMIPGPNSTEMAIHIGYSRGGIPGLIVAGVCFIVPAALIVLAIAVGYVQFGTLPQLERMLYAIKPVVIAIIAFAVADLGRTATKTQFLAVLGVAAAIANLLGMHELGVLFGAGFVSFMWKRGIGISSTVLRAVVPLEMFLYFLKIGSVLFGSGYVLVAFLQADLVEKAGVLTQRQLIDAIAVGQITPGPLFTTATFIGYLLAGTGGAILGTIGIFLPAFIFVAITHPFVRRLRKNPAAQAILDGINVAAVAVMAVVIWRLAHAAFVDGFSFVIGITAAAVLWRFRGASAWVVLGAAMIGLISDLFV